MVWVLNGAGLALTAGVLLTSSDGDRLGAAAPPTLAAGLMVLTAGTAMLLWLRRYAYGAAVAGVTVAVICLSLMPWYGLHGVHTPAGWKEHRHTLWELGHVH
jgi:hypothetical protein